MASPLITEPQPIDAPEEELFVSRNSEQECTILLLLNAMPLQRFYPLYHLSTAGATRYAALALKSRAMLYAASIATFGTQQLNGLLGFPSGEANTYWQQAYDAAKLIIDSEQFALYEEHDDKAVNYQYIFLDERNSETIFAKVYNGKDQVGHSFDYYNFPAGFERNWGGTTSVYLETVEDYDYRDGTSGKLDRDFLQSNLISFDELFDNKDPRFFASILFPGATFRNGKVYCP